MDKTITELLCDNCTNRNKDCSLWNNDKCFETAEAILYKPIITCVDTCGNSTTIDTSKKVIT